MAIIRATLGDYFDSDLYRTSSWLKTVSGCGCANHGKSRSVTSPLVWTNMLLIVPALSYLEKRCILSFSCLLISSIASMAYHRFAETDRLLLFDRVSAVCAFLVTAPRVLWGVGVFELLFSSLLIAMAFGFKTIQDKNYSVYHSLWHFFIFLGQIYLCIISDGSCFLKRNLL
mmetsp:Transcript_5809/g.6698  ORF Transcript_5809/g.6698 Transcript_5809/m.6698 type:complete len:172 (+) Transcript_5809:118-633(+)